MSAVGVDGLVVNVVWPEGHDGFPVIDLARAYALWGEQGVRGDEVLGLVPVGASAPLPQLVYEVGPSADGGTTALLVEDVAVSELMGRVPEGAERCMRVTVVESRRLSVGGVATREVVSALFAFGAAGVCLAVGLGLEGGAAPEGWDAAAVVHVCVPMLAMNAWLNRVGPAVLLGVGAAGLCGGEAIEA